MHLLNNKTFILVLAFFTGLLFSEVASLAGFLTLPALAVVLTVSTTQINIKDFLPLKNIIRPIGIAFILNYLLLSSIMLLLAWWLMPLKDLWIGYVILAAAPPGIAIIPYTHILRGDLRLSLIGTMGMYLISLLITPLIIYLFTGETAVSPMRIFFTMLQLIIIPFALSQIIRISKLNYYVSRYRGNIINWGFFVVIFTVVGLNQEVFLKDYQILIPVSLVAIITSFILSFLTEIVCKLFKIPMEKRNSYLLLSSIKTSAFAAAVALNLFNETASIPGAVISAWYALYFIYLGIKGNRIGKTNPVA